MLFFLISRFIIIPAYTTFPPVIDGNEDSVYNKISPISDFFQYLPFSDTLPTESTHVYFLYDRNNLYVFFKCFTKDNKGIERSICSRDSWEGDHIWIIIDTNNDKTTAYEFCVNAAGVQRDGILYNNAGSINLNWDGVWYSAVKIEIYGYNVEMKIPFKTLRFDPMIDSFGLNIIRYISKSNEYDSWTRLNQQEGNRVSKCGVLKGIRPEVQGLHLEVYPVGILRYENGFSPEGGFDINWEFLPSAGVSFTFFPDFAQIEADPYKINLSKYELYFPEKRPFFTQQSEYFRAELTSFIRPFYTRRIGKKLPDGKEVPIIFGGKFTGRFGRWDIGILNAMTGEREYIDYYGDTLTEEKSNYYCLRAKRGIFYNSTIGMIYAGKRDENNKNEIYGVDGSFRSSDAQLSYLFSFSNKDDTIGFGGEVKYDYSGRKFIFISDIKTETKDFNIEEIGYAPYRDYEECSIYGGLRTYNKGIIRYMHTGLGVNVNKEGADPGYGYGINSTISINFTNNYGISFSPAVNYDYEMGKFYRNNNFSLMFWTDTRKAIIFNPYIWYNSYEYNYRRGHFGANGGGEFYIRIRPLSRWSIHISPTVSIEWKEDRSIENISYIIRPSMDYFITKDLSLRFYAEPNTDTHIHYFSGLLSWNFRPKSWFYLAYNEERDNTEGNWGLRNRILVAKIRYLFFW